MADLKEPITVFTDQLRELLLYKNRKYGNSALKPVHIFNKHADTTAIEARIDDKLSRIMYGDAIQRNDVIDLIGYLVLYCISEHWLYLEDLKD